MVKVFNKNLGVMWHINVYGLINAEAFLVEEEKYFLSTHSLDGSGGLYLSEVISQKGNLIAKLGFELAYCDVTVELG